MTEDTYSVSHWLGRIISAKGTIFSVYIGNTSFGTYCNNITHLSAWMLLPDSVKFILMVVPVRFSYGAFSVLSMPLSGLDCWLLSCHVTLLLIVTWQQFHEDCEKIVSRILVDRWSSLSDLDPLADFSFKLFSLVRTDISLTVMLWFSFTLCSPTAVSGPLLVARSLRCAPRALLLSPTRGHRKLCRRIKRIWNYTYIKL